MTALPAALDRFGTELELAVRRDARVRHRRRRLLQAAALSATVVAIALGTLAVLPSGGSSVVGQAAAALDVSEGTILHLELRGEQHNQDGSVVTWHSESWQLGGAPFTRRQIEVGPDRIRAESLVRGETNELYDAERNTIYIASQKELVAASPLPKIHVVSKARYRELTHDSRGDAALKVKRSGSYSVIATKGGAERLREQRAGARVSGDSNGVFEEPFRAEALALLASGNARETGHVDVGGRDALRIESQDGRKVYLVDAVTYAPIEWRTSGDGGSVTLRFPVYEELRANAESMELLDLEAQHPQARVVHDPDAYRAAEDRLFPHG
jgi:hypothetical protein